MKRKHHKFLFSTKTAIIIVIWFVNVFKKSVEACGGGQWVTNFFILWTTGLFALFLVDFFQVDCSLGFVSPPLTPLPMAGNSRISLSISQIFPPETKNRKRRRENTEQQKFTYRSSEDWNTGLQHSNCFWIHNLHRAPRNFRSSDCSTSLPFRLRVPSLSMEASLSQ